jgi:hypothetical protein
MEHAPKGDMLSSPLDQDSAVRSMEGQPSAGVKRMASGSRPVKDVYPTGS